MYQLPLKIKLQHFAPTIESAGGDSAFLLERIKDGKMSVIELFDTMGRNGITFKHNKSKG